MGEPAAHSEALDDNGFWGERIGEWLGGDRDESGGEIFEAVTFVEMEAGHKRGVWAERLGVWVGQWRSDGGN